jgi:hypothetical protein
MPLTPFKSLFTAKRMFPVALIFAAVMAGCFGTESNDKNGNGNDYGNGNGNDNGNGEVVIDRAWMLDTGAVLFQSCTGCHGIEGEGFAPTYPPLANTDHIMANTDRVIEVLLRGGGDWQGDSIVVNGMVFGIGQMQYFGYWSDAEIAATLTYIRAVLTDSTVVSCEPATTDPETGDPVQNCVLEERTEAEIAADSIAVETVASIRDSLIAAELIDPRE